MIARLLFLFVFFCLFFTACATSATSSSSDASLTAGDSIQEKKAKLTEGCRGADLLRELDAAYAANPYRTKAEYQSKKMCVEGTVTEFLEMYGGPGTSGGPNRKYPAIHVDVAPGAGFLISSYSFSENPENWEGWMMAVSVGDQVQANCYYALDRFEIWTHPYPESGSIFEAFVGCEVRK